jgi:hypothetical protein
MMFVFGLPILGRTLFLSLDLGRSLHTNRGDTLVYTGSTTIAAVHCTVRLGRLRMSPNPTAFLTGHCTAFVFWDLWTRSIDR